MYSIWNIGIAAFMLTGQYSEFLKIIVMLNHRKIEPSDDRRIAEIIRANLKKAHLNIPGTAYFDPELDHLSAYYNSDPTRRVFFVALGEQDDVIGGVGIAEFDGIENCAELQKLYLDDSVIHEFLSQSLRKLMLCLSGLPPSF